MAYADNCPISTEGLRMLVEMLSWLEPETVQAEKRAKAEAEAKRTLMNDRMRAAFGEQVYSLDVSFELLDEVKA
jgi:hypothetical protein